MRASLVSDARPLLTRYVHVARVTIDPTFRVGAVDPRVFGTFVEHLGRCVYTGIFEPGHPTADEHGFRGDVAELVRRARRDRWCATRAATSSPATAGRTASDRGTSGPRRLDLAWRSVETTRSGRRLLALGSEQTGWRR